MTERIQAFEAYATARFERSEAEDRVKLLSSAPLREHYTMRAVRMQRLENARDVLTEARRQEQEALAAYRKHSEVERLTAAVESSRPVPKYKHHQPR